MVCRVVHELFFDQLRGCSHVIEGRVNVFAEFVEFALQSILFSFQGTDLIVLLLDG